MNSSTEGEENAPSPASKQSSGSDESKQADDPGFAKVRDFLLYSLSIPERTLRSSSAMLGGALHESATLLTPQAFQDSKSYKLFVEQTLGFMTRDIGGVEHPKTEEGSEEGQNVEGFVARKTIGGFIDLAGMATMHLSPMTVLAIVSDVAYGSQVYLKELSEELKKQGVIDQQTTIDHAADLLEAVKKASATTADAFDMPPLSVEGLKNTIDQTTSSVAKIDVSKLIPQAEMKKLWDDMHEIASKEGVGVMEVSSTMTLYSLNQIGAAGRGALSSVSVAGNLFDKHLIKHYTSAVADIRQKGLYATMAESSEPYIEAVWRNFSSAKQTTTEDVVTGRLFGRVWRSARQWMKGKTEMKGQSAESEPDESESEEDGRGSL